MERSDLEKSLRQLQELEKRIDYDTDKSEYIDELNEILNGLSKSMRIDVVNKQLPNLFFMNLSNNPDPVFAHKGDSGFDLRAYLINDEVVRVPPGQVRIIPTGLYFEIEEGMEIQVRSRSGLASRNNIMVLNSPGTIDSHYRGEIKIILANLGDEKFGDETLIVKNGDRIAQGVVCPVYGEGRLNIVKAEKLSETERGSDGFGSTGIS